MADASPTDRIDAALTRIERAVQTRERSTNDLKDRHDALRARVGEAIARARRAGSEEWLKSR